ncbi:MAG TPA: hypothetical protein VGH33_24315 [Isosphaeraceae bacterium]
MIWQFLLYTFICFVISFVLVEYGQRYLYDEVTPYVGLKVLGGAVVMGALLTWTKSSFDTMFTADLPYTALVAIVWAGVFVLAFRFQPVHGALFALAAVLLLPGLATIAVESVMRPSPNPATVTRGKAKPPRRSLGGPPPVVTPEAAAK